MNLVTLAYLRAWDQWLCMVRTNVLATEAAVTLASQPKTVPVPVAPKGEVVYLSSLAARR